MVKLMVPEVNANSIIVFRNIDGVEAGFVVLHPSRPRELVMTLIDLHEDGFKPFTSYHADILATAHRNAMNVLYPNNPIDPAFVASLRIPVFGSDTAYMAATIAL